jgi:hypothetical protein
VASGAACVEECDGSFACGDVDVPGVDPGAEAGSVEQVVCCWDVSDDFAVRMASVMKSLAAGWPASVVAPSAEARTATAMTSTVAPSFVKMRRRLSHAVALARRR